MSTKINSNSDSNNFESILKSTESYDKDTTRFLSDTKKFSKIF